MSWLDDIVDFGSSALSWFTGSSQGANLARTALAGYTLTEVTQSINRDNEKSNSSNNSQSTADKGVRIQVNPSPDQKIPVVYGKAALGGIITDAVLASGGQTMYYCITLCEQTGYTNLGTGAISDIKFKDIYWNNQRLIFNQSGAGAGYVVAASVDEDGELNYDVAGLIEVFCYSGNSYFPVLPGGYTNPATYNAFDLMPGWTPNHIMASLVFAIVTVTYNKEKNVTGLGDMTFVLENSMKEAGDCLFDYMTNTVYGAGINPAEIYAS